MWCRLLTNTQIQTSLRQLLITISFLMSYSLLQLTLIRQLIDSNCTDIFLSNDKSKITQSVKHNCCEFLQVRKIDLNTKFELHNFKKANIEKHITQKWKNSFTNSCLHSGTNYEILHLLSDVTSIIDKIPLYRRPRLVSSLCALLTEHSRLQLHLYKLKLTFSPTCICLAEDETSIHFLSECKLFSHIRNRTKPMPEDWHSIIDFIKGIGRLP